MPNIEPQAISDLINYIGNLSKQIIYYDAENNISGTFFEMFSYDESFLISDILQLVPARCTGISIFGSLFIFFAYLF